MSSVADRIPESLRSLTPWPYSVMFDQRRYKSTENRLTKILRLLGQKGPLNQYAICKHLMPDDGSEPTILYAVHELKNNGAIETVRVNHHARGAKPSEYYELSLLGLAKLVSRLEDNENDHKFLDHLVEKYQGKIGKVARLWSAFLQAGLLPQARRMLAAFSQYVCMRLELLSQWLRIDQSLDSLIPTSEGETSERARSRKQLEETLVAEAFRYFMIWGEALEQRTLEIRVVRDPSDEKARRWLNAIRSNNQLRNAMIEEVRALTEQYREAGKEIAGWVDRGENLVKWLEI